MESHTAQLQVITENGELANNFKSFVRESGIKTLGKNYHMVSIIGNQSTGKSTLLNALFGTTFEVMDSSRSRKQTTKGVQVSKDKEQNIFVLDVEGADSKERWEDHQPFEQSTALFVLVLSQVIMVNIWTHEVGRFTGANYGVLKAIFENNLKLFKQEGMKTLIFILRDYDEVENFQAIRETLMQDVYRIWSEINKPKEYSGTLPSNFFDFEFVCLPTYKWQKDKFLQQVSQFRERFLDEKREDYLFKVNIAEKNVPMDGLPFFMENVWTTIKECKDINLPSQRILVANMRCTDIKNDAIQGVQDRLNSLKSNASKAFHESFGKEGQEILQEALKSYDQNTENYDKTVVSSKREELLGVLSQGLYEIFEVQVSLAKRDAVNMLTNSLQSFNLDLSKGGSITGKIDEAFQKAYRRFEDNARKIFVVGCDWNIENSLSEINQQMREMVTMFTDKQIAGILKKRSTDIRRDIDAQIMKQFNDLDKDFWVVLENFYNETMKVHEGYIKEVVSNSFSLSENLVEGHINRLNEEAYKDLQSDLENRFSDVGYFLMKKFKREFGKSELRGVKLNWRELTPQQLEERYLNAKNMTLEILEGLRYFQIQKRGEGYLEKKPVVSEKEFEHITNRITEDMESEFQDAERRRTSHVRSTVPIWLWVLLIVFMSNDLLRWSKSPYIEEMMYVLGIITCLILLGNIIGMGDSMKASALGVVEFAKNGVVGSVKRVGRVISKHAGPLIAKKRGIKQE